MIKKYIINQLTDLSAWIGAFVVIAGVFLPVSVTIGLGLFLMFSSDSYLKNLIAKHSPKIKDILENK